MLRTRLDLHSKLCSILESTNVYFQPPENIKMNYPAIVYEMSSIKTNHADGGVYLFNKCYDITLIHNNPDNDIVDRILMEIPHSSFNRHFKSDGLNHYVFRVFI